MANLGAVASVWTSAREAHPGSGSVMLSTLPCLLGPASGVWVSGSVQSGSEILSFCDLGYSLEQTYDSLDSKLQ